MGRVPAGECWCPGIMQCVEINPAADAVITVTPGLDVVVKLAIT